MTIPAHLSTTQLEILLRPINPRRVAHRDGQSNVEAYDIRAHLTRIFGFGRWDEIAVATRMLYEQETTTKNGKDAYKVAYLAERCIRLRDQDGNLLCEHHGSAVGEAIMPDFKRGDAHDFAMKKAQSQALKRAAINLGDQFGLSLYAKGSTNVVVGTVVDYNAKTGLLGNEQRVEIHEPDVVEESDPDAVLPVEEDVPPPPTETLFVPEMDEDDPIPAHDTELMVTDAQIKKMAVCLSKLTPPRRTREERLEYMNGVLSLDVTSSKELTREQAKTLINHMEGTS
jgi:hypothetical protein